MKKITALIAALALIIFSWQAKAQVEIFTPGMTVSEYQTVNSPAGEDVTNVIDGTSDKYLDFDDISNDGLGFTVDLGGTAQIAKSIEITTANDSPDRDPEDYEIFGSNDGTSFTSIATGSMPCITTRHFSRRYNFTNSTAYTHYRINLTARCGGGNGIYQVEEVQLYDAQFCLDPTDLTVTNLTTTSADLEWTESGTATLWDIEWGSTGFTQGSGTTITGHTTNSLSLSSLTPNTTYDFYVRADCGANQSVWVGPFTFSSGYCTPSASNPATYINDFSTTGGSANISNLGSGFTTGGYFNGTAQSVESYETSSFDFNATIDGGTVGFAIWVDWNNDLVFDNATEKVFNTTSYSNGPFTGTITVPSGTAVGNYTMRTVAHYNDFNPSDPCDNGTRLEFEDYTISVIAPPGCLAPIDLAATNITAFTADLGWTSTATTWDIELGTAGFTPTGSPTTTGTTTNPYNATGLTASTSYDFYVRTDCGGGDLSDWTGPFNFTTPVSCIAPTALTVSNITLTSVDLGWTSTATTWDIEWDVAGFTQGTGTTITGTTTNPHNLTGLTAYTSYDFYVKANCGGINGASTWSGPFNFYTGHCIPSASNPATYINDFSTSNGSTNISNLGSGFTTGGYFDGTAQSVQGYETSTFDFNAAIAGGTVGFAIWVDWNNDLVFDNATEKVFNTTSYSNGPFTGTITIPAGTAVGNYTMRTVAHYNAANPSDPCANGTRLEFEDYTINVIPQPSCLPPIDLAATNITAFTADLGWTSTATTWDIELGAAGFTPTGTPTTTGTTTNPHNATGLTASTSYDFYVRADCGGSLSTWAGPFNFTTPVSCIAPTALTVSNMTPTSVDLGWTSTATTWDIEWDVAGFTQGTGTTITGTTTNPHNLTGLTANTSYDFYVRADCGGINGASTWSGPFTFYTGYCTPSASDPATYINDFSTTNGSANISNLGSGFTTGGYFDGTAQSVESYETASFDFNATIDGGTVGFAIWVDWNNDLVFDNATEKVFNTNSYSNGPFTGTITVPSGTAIGEYKMRTIAHFNASNPSDPCASSTRLESEDYTINVIAPPGCLAPIELTATNNTPFTADLGWASSANMWDIELGTAGFTPTGTPTTTGATTNPYNVTGLTANTSYDFYVRTDCGGGDLSPWAGPFSFYTGYCTPSASDPATYINDFSTTNGSANISNLGSGFTTGGYFDGTAQSVESFATSSFDFNATIDGGTVGFAIWVDWNNDLVFDNATEKVFNTNSYSNGPFTGTITIPAGTALGDYTMRTVAHFNAFNPSDPCANGTRLEFEDYTIRVIEEVLCTDMTLANDYTGCAGDGYSVTVNSIVYNESNPNGTDTLLSIFGCDSIIITNLTFNEASSSTITETTCEENLEYNGDTYTTTGVYTQTLTNALGCDSVLTLDLTFNTATEGTFVNSICDDSYELNGETYTATGIYTQTLTNALGCDSVLTLDLTFNTATESTLVDTICDSSYEVNGETYTSTGIYTQTLTNSNGCDSILTLDLIIGAIDSVDVTQVTCSDSLTFNGVTYTSTGTYEQTLTNMYGCDSVVTYHLNLGSETHGFLTELVCEDSIIINGVTYNSTGNYTQTIPLSVTCDSILQIDLTFIDPTSETLTETTCEESLEYNGQTYTASGTYTQTLTNAVGCDSTLTLDLVFNTPTSETITESTCLGSLEYNGQTYTASGTYTQTLTNAVGCDSTLTLDLVFNTSTSETIIESTCLGSLEYNGQTYTETGTYTQTLTNVVGCDSTLTLELVINEPTSETLVESTCSGSLEYNGQIYTESGVYTQNLTNVGGCDSTLTLDLTINSETSGVYTETTCEDELTVNSIVYTASGTYTQVLTNSMGCDSTLTLNLTMGLHSEPTSVYELICEEEVNINGVVYTETGIYAQMLTNVFGCDSVVNYDLNFSVGDSMFIDTLVCGQNVFEYNGNLMFATGTYEFEQPVFGGCPTLVTIDVEFVDEFTVEITQVGNTLVCNQTTGTFQWYDCDTGLPGIGETNNTLEPQINAEYYVEVTQNGCTYISECFTTFGIGINDKETSLFAVYPNPNNGVFTVKWDESAQYTKLKLTSTVGQVIYESDVYTQQSKLDLELQLASGVYYVQMLNANNKWENSSIIVK